MPISVVFDPPLPSDSPSTFNTKAFTLLGDLNDWSTQANALPGEVATNLTTLLAAPPAIGSTTPAAVSATTLSASGLTKINGATNSSSTMLGVKVATDAQLWVRPGTELGGSAGVGIQSSNDAGSGSTALTLYGSSIKLDGGAVTIPGSLGVNSPITLTAANPYISFVGTAATRNWRLGDGLGAANGNFVLYDYTSSVKAIEVTKGTGAVTIPGNTGIGLANVGVSKLEVSKDNDTLLLSGATSGGSNTPGIAFRTNPNTPTSWTSAAIKAYDGGESYGAGLKFYVNSGTTAVAASTLAIDIAQTGAVTFNSGTFGYGTGAGGTVTQATSKGTGVALNKPSGKITMHNAALADGAQIEFNFVNSTISLGDKVIVHPDDSTFGMYYRCECYFVSAGSAYIKVTNTSAGSRSDALPLTFAVIKGATT